VHRVQLRAKQSRRTGPVGRESRSNRSDRRRFASNELHERHPLPLPKRKLDTHLRPAAGHQDRRRSLCQRSSVSQPAFTHRLRADRCRDAPASAAPVTLAVTFLTGLGLLRSIETRVARRGVLCPRSHRQDCNSKRECQEAHAKYLQCSGIYISKPPLT
jgi:hypothetical protein